ncbi:MAG: thioredoxin family protein [Chitinophagales bacterium]
MKTTLILIANFILLFQIANAGDGVEVGDIAPGFELKNIDERKLSLDSYTRAEGVILIFSCNHCPYVKLYEDRINALDAKYKKQGYPVVAINPNDPEIQPADSFDKMKERAKEKNFTFPYLIDQTQEIAKAYGATRTPHVYLLKATESGQFTVAYIGAIDNDTEGKLAKTERVNYVEDAIAALQNGESPDPDFTKAIGCTIKWSK